MTLQLILGPAHAGKTEYICRDIQNRIADGVRSWILVPEQFSLFTEKEVIRRFGLPAQKQVKVISFARLCNLVLHHTGPLRMRYIDGAGKRMIAERTIQLLEGELTFLRRNLHQKGFAATLTETFSECKRYGVSPQALQFAAANAPYPELSAKLSELAMLYETYHNLIETHHADAEDNLTLICPKIKDCDFLTGKLYILHFRSFTPVEYRALGALMQRLSVCAAFDYSRAPHLAALFAPTKNTIETLCETADACGAETAEPVFLTRTDAEDALSHLQTQYFAYRAPAYSAPQNAVHVYELQNRYREAEAAADLILRLCRTEGYRLRDFLILTRNMESYAKILPAIFQSRGMNLFFDSRRSIASFPLTRLILAITEILAFGPSFERVMTIAKTALYDLSRDDIDRFENYLLASAPTHAMWQAKTWDYLPNGSDYDLDTINQTKDLLLSGVHDVSEKITGTKTGGEIADALYDYLEKSGLWDRVLSKAQTAAAANVDSDYAEECRQAANGIGSILSQISTMMKDVPMTYRRFYELLHETCADTEIGMTPQTIDCVIFSRIDRFRSDNAKAVLVLDTTEGVFPKGYNSEGFLSDSERHVLKQLGIVLAPGQNQKRQEEQLLIHAVLNAPTKQIYFFRPMTDTDGSTLSPSGILKRVYALFSDLTPVRPDTGEDPFLQTEGKSGAFYLLSAALAECSGDIQKLSAPFLSLFQWFQKDKAYGAVLNRLLTAMAAPPPTTLTPALVEQLYGAPLRLSASQLESYNSCAFAYFLTYGLLLKERETAEIEPRSMGSIQHAALYDYFSDLANRRIPFSSVTREDCMRDISAAVQKEAEKNKGMIFESSAYYQYIILRMKEIAACTAWEVVKFYQSSNFNPYGFELKIGTDGGIPALSVTDEKNREIAKIRGIIDRADIADCGGKQYVSIVDYKSSAKNLDVTLAKDGIAIQPLLYADALCRQLGNAEPAAMFYLHMNDPIMPEDKIKKGLEAAVDAEMKPRGWMIDDPTVQNAYSIDGSDAFLPKTKSALIAKEEMQRRIEAANATIKKSAIQIASGRIEAAPYRTAAHDACEYCAYFGICKKES